jgi:Arc/MetJ-type ribon-helix-helix transcriptional regulator
LSAILSYEQELKNTENRVTVRIEDDEKGKIESRIKQDYPKLKNVSELVRAALTEFLDGKKEQERNVG